MGLLLRGKLPQRRLPLQGVAMQLLLLLLLLLLLSRGGSVPKQRSAC